MISWGDVYKVVEAMVPLYTTLALGYASARWWRVFTPEQSDAVNKLVSHFALPLFNLEFMLHTDPFAMNLRFAAADAVAKAATVLALAAYAASRGGGGEDGLACAVSGFSLIAFTNCLVVGVPLLRAMYGPLGQDIAVQSFVLQALVWLTVFILALEYRKAAAEYSCAAAAAASVDDGSGAVCIQLPSENPAAVDGEHRVITGAPASTAVGAGARYSGKRKPPSFWSLVKVVLVKLSQNPNTYSSVLGIAWAAAASRWHLHMPAIVEGSVLIMSKAGAGLSMFSMGLFMANQKRVVACGPRSAVLAMALRFVAAPFAMALGSLSVRLRGDVLRVAILQAALPQAVTAFVFAREYGLHANVLSTAVIFEMLSSLPMLIVYYMLLECFH